MALKFEGEDWNHRRGAENADIRKNIRFTDRVRSTAYFVDGQPLDSLRSPRLCGSIRHGSKLKQFHLGLLGLRAVDGGGGAFGFDGFGVCG